MSIYFAGNEMHRSDPYIPAHLLGDVWAIDWTALYQYHGIKPFRNVTSANITAALNQQSYTALRMFEMADEFFISLGLPSNNISYTGNSIIEEPYDRKIQCHATAMDLCNGKDFRIKMCARTTQQDLFAIYHQMGHIQYFIQNEDQPATLRGASPGFREALGKKDNNFKA